jgi:hypothetical protein
LFSILAVWRVAHLLWGEDGPGDIVVRVRRLVGEGFFRSSPLSEEGGPNA